MITNSLLRKIRWKILNDPRRAMLYPYGKDLKVREDSILLVEGYPRSANSFTVGAIKQNNTGHIASHLHCIGHVKQAIDMNIPCLILIRPPAQAVPSFLAWNNRLGAKQLLKEYISFYTQLMPYRHLIVTAEFDEVTTDLDHIIYRLNKKFGCELRFSGDTSSVDRNATKPGIIDNFFLFEKHHQLIMRADDVYRRFFS